MPKNTPYEPIFCKLTLDERSPLTTISNFFSSAHMKNESLKAEKTFPSQRSIIQFSISMHSSYYKNQLIRIIGSNSRTLQIKDKNIASLLGKSQSSKIFF